VLDQTPKQLDGRALGAHDLIADHTRDHEVVTHPPERDPLVPCDQLLCQLKQVLVLTALAVELDDIQPVVAEKLLERSGVTLRISRKPGESKPLPCPSTLRISWYSHGDICSSMSS